MGRSLAEDWFLYWSWLTFHPPLTQRMSDRSALKPIRSPQGEAEKSPVNSLYITSQSSIALVCLGLLPLRPLNHVPGEWKATSLLFSPSPFNASGEGNEPPGDFIRLGIGV